MDDVGGRKFIGFLLLTIVGVVLIYTGRSTAREFYEFIGWVFAIFAGANAAVHAIPIFKKK